MRAAGNGRSDGERGWCPPLRPGRRRPATTTTQECQGRRGASRKARDARQRFRCGGRWSSCGRSRGIGSGQARRPARAALQTSDGHNPGRSDLERSIPGPQAHLARKQKKQMEAAGCEIHRPISSGDSRRRHRSSTRKAAERALICTTNWFESSALTDRSVNRRHAQIEGASNEDFIRKRYSFDGAGALFDCVGFW